LCDNDFIVPLNPTSKPRVVSTLTAPITRSA